eukprot:CAMPEP_0168351064 /NCGR_PEP_ID=MMETSP0213-20121227/21568_1 /TAXON_ID=151035 /ORGANISM="Euplotes harpa, Strain FSP1.4" /LENGTH=59 /DNA_ID=CAMNT_0008361683 /DNA_START=27 /DNA_END=203 /DNA_ORIENTATION=-
MAFFETSSKDDININEMFAFAAAELKQKADDGLLLSKQIRRTPYLNQAQQDNRWFGKTG